MERRQKNIFEALIASVPKFHENYQPRNLRSSVSPRYKKLEEKDPEAHHKVLKTNEKEDTHYIQKDKHEDGSKFLKRNKLNEKSVEHLFKVVREKKISALNSLPNDTV